jgi:hypothetical protein
MHAFAAAKNFVQTRPLTAITIVALVTLTVLNARSEAAQDQLASVTEIA